MAFNVAADLAAFKINEAELTALLNGPSGPVVRDLTRRAIKVESSAKQHASGRPGPNVRTGRLRGSITWRVGVDRSPYADIGSAVVYCVFGGHTQIVTDRGLRTIGQVKPGERVLTQAGDFQHVLAKTAFPAVEKPDLVDLVVPWREDRDHRLTLTLDHKVLCFRDGRNQWVMAGDLRGGDLLYDRVKLAHNKGRKPPLKTCEQCGDRHRRQGKRYCSVRCRNEAWASGKNPHLGMVRSDATRALLREKCLARRSGLTLNRRLAEKGFRTSHEREVEEWLVARGVLFEMQVPLGGHVVDFFLPETREVLEADGAYWHQDQRRDIERDCELLQVAPGIEITHLHFFDKRFSPPLDEEPLPGVRYVACNPGPASFIDPARFRQRPVRIARHWRYGENIKPKGSPAALLYDIAVEGVNSFLTSGIVISNSIYVEMGTSRAQARPFLRPALEAAR